MSDDLYKIDFAIGKSLRYHAKRRSFFDFIHRGSQAVSALAGSAAFVSLVGGQSPELAKIAAALLAAVSALNLVIGFSERARQYDGLYKRFSDLAVEIAECTQPTEELVRKWKAARLRIEKDEPTPLSALNVICHNEEAEARGLGIEYQYKIGILKSTFRHLFTFPPDRYESIKALEERRFYKQRSSWFYGKAHQAIPGSPSIPSATPTLTDDTPESTTPSTAAS